MSGEAELTPSGTFFSDARKSSKSICGLAGSEDEPEPSPGKADAVLASRRKRRHRRHLRKPCRASPPRHLCWLSSATARRHIIN